MWPNNPLFEHKFMPSPSLPDNFYYFPRESRLQYSDIPQGDIDFNRLMENRPDYWVNPATARGKKNKKLILANWGIANSYYRVRWDEVKVALYKLLDADFQLYYWENGAIIPITKKLIEKPEYYSKIKYRAINGDTFEDKIMDSTVSKYSFTREELLVIDDFWIEYLAANGENNKYTANTSTCNNDNKLSILKRSSQSVTDIISHNYDKVFNRKEKLLREAFPKAKVHSLYNYLQLDALDTINFINALSKNKKYILESAVFTPKHLEKIIRLILDCSALVDTKLLATVLKKFTNLGSLTLAHTSIESSNILSSKLTYIDFKEVTIKGINLNPGQLKELRDISLENCTISASDLKKLIATSPGLESLTLSRCTIDGLLNFSDLNFSTLSKIRIDSNQIILLHQLEKIAPGLKTLTLERSYNPLLEPLIQSLLLKGVLIEWIDEEVVILGSNSKTIAPSLQIKFLRSQNGEQSLDADTVKDPNTILPVQRIFFALDGSTHPSPNSYRLESFNDFAVKEVPCSIKTAFTLKNKGNLELEPCKVIASDVDVYDLAKQHNDKETTAYYGKQKLIITNEWQAIASLSPEENLFAYHLDPNAAVEIQYSKRDNLYYIRTKEDVVEEVSLDFIVKVPKQTKVLPSEIDRLAHKYKNFTDGGLVLDTLEPTGRDYLNAIQDQGKGACRHRAFAFKAAMKEAYPDIPVRIIYNDCHAYVEIYSEGHWIKQDLKGYEGQLEIIEPAFINNKAQQLAKSPGERYLETWNKEALIEESIPKFCQKTLQPNERNKRLIELSSTSDLNAVRYLLQHHAKHSGCPVFYINSPEELVCAAPWIKKRQERGKLQGVLTAGPGGPLHQFITDNPQQEQRVLLINYENFTPEDVVRLNSILDQEPMIDGVKIPSSLTIVGLTNSTSPNYYTGADFNSRFDVKSIGPDSNALAQALRPHIISPRAVTKEDNNAEHVHLFNSANWKNILLGHWIMEGKNIIFKEGVLQKTLKSGKPLVIHQGLWSDDEFVHFWQQAKLNGRIEHSGGVIKIPDSLELVRDDTYDWKALVKNIQANETFDEQVHILNPSTIKNFFNYYNCDNTSKTLNYQPGFIESCPKGKTLSVYVTRELTEDQWAMLGALCNEHNVTLLIHPAPGVTLPAELRLNLLETKPVISAWDKSHSLTQNTLIINSSDIDATLSMLTEDDLDWQVIDVSTCKSSDLLTNITASFTQKTLSFQFGQEKKALLMALEAGKKVILKGTFSPELLDELVSLTAATNEGR